MNGWLTGCVWGDDEWERGEEKALTSIWRSNMMCEGEATTNEEEDDDDDDDNEEEEEDGVPSWPPWAPPAAVCFFGARLPLPLPP